MAFGSYPLGTVSVGGNVPKITWTFDVEKEIDNKSIIRISDKVGQDLIEHFKKHPEQLKNVDRRKFEEIVAELFDGFGYDVELTQQTRDGGKDIIAIKHHFISEKFLIECKRPDPENKVGIRAVRELLGVKADQGATKAILVTTAYFSRDAQLLFDRNEWELEGKDFDDLKNWIDEYAKLKTK